jgi:hypothetical protein
VFGLRNDRVGYHLLIPHLFCLVCGMKLVDAISPHSSQANN